MLFSQELYQKDMRFIDFFKGIIKKDLNKAEPLLAMPIFNNHETFDLKIVLAYLQTEWKSDIEYVNGGNGKASFYMDGESVSLTTVPQQVPSGNIQYLVHNSHKWETAEQDLKNHNLHVIVSVMSGKKSYKERFQILSKLLSAILATTNCIGIYYVNQQKLFQRGQCMQEV